MYLAIFEFLNNVNESEPNFMMDNDEPEDTRYTQESPLSPKDRDDKSPNSSLLGLKHQRMSSKNLLSHRNNEYNDIDIDKQSYPDDDSNTE